MTLFLAGLGMSSYFLALCYVLGTFISIIKFRRIHFYLESKGKYHFHTVRLVIMSILLGCLFRTMSFSTLCFLDFVKDGVILYPQNNNTFYQNNIYKYIFNQTSNKSLEINYKVINQDLIFYNKVVAVLFNLPDYLFVSSYLLVVIVWAETFLMSRKHNFSLIQHRRKWIIFYLIFNGLLYLIQLILYSLLFHNDQVGIFQKENGKGLKLIPGLIFYVAATADLLLPLVLFISWIYLSYKLMGYPYKSLSAKFRLRRVGKVVFAWSLGRILYSTMILLTFTKGWFRPQEHNSTIQSMVLVAVFLACELVPIYLLLDSELLAMLSSDNYKPLTDNKLLEI